MEVLKLIEEKLKNKGLNVIRTPFGWFNTLEIKAIPSLNYEDNNIEVVDVETMEQIFTVETSTHTQ
ncbi:MAG: threonyl-tRNA synthetase editing domain-containing protein [Actinomycetota bacterium]